MSGDVVTTRESAVADRAEAFWAQVDMTPTCWLWTGVTSKGYGQFYFGGLTARAHRFSYELVRPIPDGLVIDHLCRVRNCVNPDHMEPVENRVNVLRGIGTSAVNARKAECSKGHPFDDVNTYFRRGRRYCRTCKTTPVPCAECDGEFSPASLTRHIRRFHLVAS